MTCAARCYAAAGNCSPSYSWRTTCTCSSRRLAPILRGACGNSSHRMPSGTDDDIVESGTCSRDGTGPNSSRMRATIGPSAGISTSIRSVLGSSMPGRMAVVELSRLCQAVPPPALGGPRGPAVGLAWRARWNRFGACLPALRGGRSEESSSRRSARPSVAGCWARSGSSLGCGSWPGLSCLIHRFRVLVNWPPEIRRPSSRRFVITSAWSVRLWRVAAIRTSLERPPPGSAASTARSRCMNWLPCSASVGPTVSPT